MLPLHALILTHSRGSANSHRVFVTFEPAISSSPVGRPASLSGVASVVDSMLLSLTRAVGLAKLI